MIVTTDLKKDLQTAIEIELSTIPIYLYTYYSINRSPDQNAIISDLTNTYIDQGMPTAEAASRAQQESVRVMVYANKAGATIMSVVVEEMLHMALASNLKRALAGMPQLVGKSPAKYPTNLPKHKGDMQIPLAPFSADQLKIFMEIEQPQPKQTNAGDDQDWETIGQFYARIIEHLVKEVTQQDYDQFKGFPQLGPNRHYYATNSVDTVYYDANHKPHYTNADDSGDLIIIDSNDTAIKAIKTIVVQGEGHDDVRLMSLLQSMNSWNDTDDVANQEESHYYKYAGLYKEYSFFEENDLVKYFVKPVPTNPVTLRYSKDIQAVSNLLNAVYTYMFMMMEACYRNGMPQQSEIFNFGIHKGMVFILSTLCDFITSMPVGQGMVAAPTFENYQFQPGSSAKSQLIALVNAIPASVNFNPNILGRIQTLPDMDIVSGKMISFA